MTRAESVEWYQIHQTHWFPGVWCDSICSVRAIIMSCSPLSSLHWDTHIHTDTFVLFQAQHVRLFWKSWNVHCLSDITSSSAWVKSLGNPGKKTYYSLCCDNCIVCSITCSFICHCDIKIRDKKKTTVAVWIQPHILLMTYSLVSKLMCKVAKKTGAAFTVPAPFQLQHFHIVKSPTLV
jgi:hypothetical protein